MTTKSPSIPIPAATVMLARDSSDGFEIFMVVRHKKIDFASGALVFPGGKVSDGDNEPELRAYCTGADSLDNETLSLRIAAIRETFEECGILLAGCRKRNKRMGRTRLSELEPYRQQIHDNEISLLEFLQKENLYLTCEDLVQFAHWITPEESPKRFDTHFFLAKAPVDQTGSHDGTESIDSVWITPEQAKEDAETGQHLIIFPTLMNITKLGQSKTLDQAITTAKSSKVVTVMPSMENRSNGAVICIPKEAGYHLTELPLEQVLNPPGKDKGLSSPYDKKIKSVMEKSEPKKS